MTTTTRAETGIVQEVGEFTFTDGRCPLVLDIWWTPPRNAGWEIVGTELPHVEVRLEIEVAIKPMDYKRAQREQTVRVASVSYPEGMELVGRGAAAGGLRDLVWAEVQKRIPLETIRCRSEVFMPSERLAQWVREKLASERADDE